MIDVIITMDNCPMCEKAKKEYPKARTVRSEELVDGTYQGADRDDLMVELQLSDGTMPLLLQDEVWP